MKRRILVIPDHPPLMERLAGRCVVIRLTDSDGVPTVAQVCSDRGILLHCVWLEMGCSLTEVPFEQSWTGIQLALRVPGMGRLQDLAGALGLLKGLAVRVYFSAAPAENLTAARILASIGIETAIDFHGGVPDWERLTDLMTYALMTPTPHAAIEPFRTIADRYQPKSTTDFGAVYLDDPGRYLHLDASGRVALTMADLAAGRWAAENFSEVDLVEDLPAYQEYLEQRRAQFLETSGCAYCEAWRVCLGRLAALDGGSACREYCLETMRVVEQRLSLKSQEVTPWQP